MSKSSFLHKPEPIGLVSFADCFPHYEGTATAWPYTDTLGKDGRGAKAAEVVHAALLHCAARGACRLSLESEQRPNA